MKKRGMKIPEDIPFKECQGLNIRAIVAKIVCHFDVSRQILLAKFFSPKFGDEIEGDENS